MQSTIKLVLVLSLLYTFNTSAQIVERLKKEVKSNTEKKVLENIESENSNENFNRKRPGRNSLTNDEESKQVKTTSSDSSTTSSSAEVEESYIFTNEMEAEILSTNKKGVANEPSTIIFAFGENCFMNEVTNEKTKIRNILDYSNNVSIMLNEDQKTATVMSLKFANKFMKSVKSDDYVITKTGNTKTILGYNCEEYILESDKIIVHSWVTNEIEMEYSKELQSYISKQFPQINFTNDDENASKSLTLESHSTNKKKPKEKTDFYIRRIEKVDNQIHLNNYSVTKLF